MLLSPARYSGVAWIDLEVGVDHRRTDLATPVRSRGDFLLRANRHLPTRRIPQVGAELAVVVSQFCVLAFELAQADPELTLLVSLGVFEVPLGLTVSSKRCFCWGTPCQGAFADQAVHDLRRHPGHRYDRLLSPSGHIKKPRNS